MCTMCRVLCSNQEEGPYGGRPNCMRLQAPVHTVAGRTRKKEPRSDFEAAVRPKKSVVCGQKASSKKSATYIRLQAQLHTVADCTT